MNILGYYIETTLFSLKYRNVMHLLYIRHKTTRYIFKRMEYIPFNEVNVGSMIKIMEYPCIVKSLTRISSIKYRIRGMDIFTGVIHSHIVDERDFVEVPFLIQKRWNVVNRDGEYLYLIDLNDRKGRVKRPGYNLQDIHIEFVITVRYGNRCKVIKYETNI
jgi:hypothetical protein